MAKEYKPPRLINGFVKLLNRAGVGRSVTLTTTGRKSGASHEVAVSPIEYEGGTYIVAPYGSVGWVLNARSNPAAALAAGRESRACDPDRSDGRCCSHRPGVLGARELSPRLHGCPGEPDAGGL